MLNFKYFSLFSIFSWLAFSAVFSSGPIAHYYFADKFLKTCCCYSKEDEQRFILGTEFPDIRYIAKIPREKTHYEKMTLESVVACPDPFEAGKMFHSYVDITRGNFVEKKALSNDKDLRKYFDGIMEKYSLNEMQAATFLKMVDDDWLFDMVNKGEAIACVSKIDKTEREFGIKEDILKRWHENNLKESFLARPSKRIANLAENNQKFLDYSPQVTKGWALDIKEALADPKVQKLINEMILHFENEFEKFKKRRSALNVKVNNDK